MKSSKVSAGDAGLASQYNNVRADAYGGSMLLAHEQTTPGMTLYVEPGVCYVGTTRVIFTGGNSPAFTAPTSNPRIDILTIDSTGTLAITEGTEASSPSAPSYPANKLVICEVYHVVGETALYDNDNQQSGEGYILNDVRPLAAPPYISSTSQFGSAVVPDSALVSTFIHDPGSDAQGDIIYFNGSSWVRLPAGTSGQFLKTAGASANPGWSSVVISEVSGTVSESLTATTTLQTDDVVCTHGLNRTPALITLSLAVQPANSPSSGAYYQQGIVTFDSSAAAVSGFKIRYSPYDSTYTASDWSYSGAGAFDVTGGGATTAIHITVSVTNVTTTQFTIHITYQITTGSGSLSGSTVSGSWSVVG